MTATALSGDIACDITIAMSVCYYLQKSRTAFKRHAFHRYVRHTIWQLIPQSTNTMINLLITYAIRTCLLTTCVSVLALITSLDWHCRVCFIACLVTVSLFHRRVLVVWSLPSNGSTLCTPRPGSTVFSFSSVVDVSSCFRYRDMVLTYLLTVYSNSLLSAWV